MPQERRPLALVTGASAGLGREFAVQLAAAGFDLVLVARREERLRALAEELHARHGATCEVLPADLVNDAGVTRVVERIDAGPPEVLVSCAGFGTAGSIVRAPRAEQDALVRIHTLTTHRLAQAAVQGMAPAGHGAVIIVASVASYLRAPGSVNYSATKAFQRVYAEALAAEVRHRGIYVQAFCPGFVHTEMHVNFPETTRRVPGWLWMSATDVVRASLQAMRDRKPVVVIPGVLYKTAVLLLRYVPHWLSDGVISLNRRLRRSPSASPRP